MTKCMGVAFAQLVILWQRLFSIPAMIAVTDKELVMVSVLRVHVSLLACRNSIL